MKTNTFFTLYQVLLVVGVLVILALVWLQEPTLEEVPCYDRYGNEIKSLSNESIVCIESGATINEKIISSSIVLVCVICILFTFSILKNINNMENY